MPTAIEHMVVLVSASSAGDDLRRALLVRGIEAGGTTGSLARLRRSLVREGIDSPIVLCVTLDEPTLRRHGGALARLLDDRAAFAAPVRGIGLVTSPNAALRSAWATIGLDAWASDARHAHHLIARFAAEFTPRRTALVRNRFAPQQRHALMDVASLDPLRPGRSADRSD